MMKRERLLLSAFSAVTMGGLLTAGGLLSTGRAEAAWQTPIPMVNDLMRSLANPNVAYILLVFGLLALVAEFAAGGTVIAGVAGALSLILALVGLGQLPTNWAGAALILAGVVMFLLDIHVSGVVLSIGGLIAFTLGSLLLFTPPWDVFSEVGAVQVSPWLVLITTGGVAGFFFLAIASVVRSRSAPVAVGRRTLIGKVGTARGTLAPQGIVLLEGEEWSAVTVGSEPIPDGAAVRVVAIQGLQLRVEPVTGPVGAAPT